MIEDPINIVLCVIGLCLWPSLTVCIIFWMMGHPFLGLLALLVISESPSKK